jgi:DNA-binding IclR family transcriptional regulator
LKHCSQYLNNLKTVKKALAVLDTFTGDVRGQGVTEIANKLKIHKSTVHAVLAALKDDGYVMLDRETRKYFLGYKILELAGRLHHQRDLRDVSRPVMEQLSKTIEEDVAVNIAIEGRRICTALVESRYFVRNLVPVGKALPLHCSAAGKVLLAYLGKGEVEEIIRRHGLQRFTPNTITQKEKLFAELREVRRRGYAESREEYGREAASVAFPLFDGIGKVVGSLSIQSTVTRLNSKTRPKFIKEGLRAAEKISSLVAGSS